MYQEFAPVLVFMFVGIAFVVGAMLVGALVRLKRTGGYEHDVYECGEPTIGSSWIRYNSRFYNIALVYLLFDVEVILLLPVLLVFREQSLAGNGITSLILVFVFLSLLVLGLAYEWFYGNLDWIRGNNHS